MSRRLFAALCGALVCMGLTACEGDQENSPQGGKASPEAEVAPAETVTDVYHGVTVEDPYRWLEDGADPAVREWVASQNAAVRAWLDAVPARPIIHDRVEALIKGGESVSYHNVTPAAGALFALKADPALQQPVLVSMPLSADPGAERVIVDPNKKDKSGGTTIDWFRVSNDGAYLAVSMSKGGSESGDLHLFDAATGKPVDAVIPRVHGGTAGGDLAWMPDASGFFYTRYPRLGERPPEDADFYQQVYFHALGTPVSADRHVFGKDLPRIAEIALVMEARSGRLLITVQDGDSGRFAHYLRAADGAITRVSRFGDGLEEVVFGPDNFLYGISKANAPRGEIVRLSAAEPDAAGAEIVVAAGDGALSHSFYDTAATHLLATGTAIFAIYQTGGPNELRVFDLSGAPLKAPPQPPVSTVSGLTSTPAGEILFSVSSYVTPPEWFAYSPGAEKSRRLGISSPATVDFSDVEVRREYAVSKDGTRVPVNILVPEGVPLDGTAPILVTGYGGFGVSITPQLSKLNRILFDNGMLFAQANLRGGGEFGEDWHKQGMLTSKQNVFDDFIAVIEHLVAEKYAAPDRVAIMGGSNGGLLMGAVLTQRPGLMAAVVSHVGIYDSLRVELDTNGAFNIPEYGTVKNPEHFRALYAYSPYHNVKDGVSYPAILLATGANDPRVNPMHSRKFAARLQAAQAGNAPILLRTEEGSGHGIGSSTSQLVELATDQYAFIFEALGVEVEKRAPAGQP